tara:strand:- start:182 stop:751 length:570 start_codon:yes stop_codon:yes gene_type:complete
MGIVLSNCANKTYSIKKEKSKQVLKVPSWYMHDYSERKECDTPKFGKNKDKKCVFGVGTSVSPDLELAIEKATLIAKSEIADKVKGEMNKKAKIFTTELGKSQTKTVVSDVETTLINVISNTPVKGYELFNQEVTLTKNGYYRAWVGLRLPMGEYNKLYNYTIEEVLVAHNVKQMANDAYKNVETTINE